MGKLGDENNADEAVQIGFLGLALVLPILLVTGGWVPALIGAILWLAAIALLARLVATRFFATLHENLLKEWNRPARTGPKPGSLSGAVRQNSSGAHFVEHNPS